MATLSGVRESGEKTRINAANVLCVKYYQLCE